MMKQTMDGSLDFIIDGPGFLGQLVKPLGIFEVPFIARDWPHVEKMLASPFGQKQFAEMASKHNMRHVTSRRCRAICSSKCGRGSDSSRSRPRS